MKKIIFILICISTIYIFADDKITNQRPSNIPDDASGDNQSGWGYEGNYSYISWYPDGSLHLLFYDSLDKKYTIHEFYHRNGRLEKKNK